MSCRREAEVRQKLGEGAKSSIVIQLKNGIQCSLIKRTRNAFEKFGLPASQLDSGWSLSRTMIRGLNDIGEMLRSLSGMTSMSLRDFRKQPNKKARG